MSTRSVIILQINPEDLGKTVVPDKQKLYAKGIKFEKVDYYNPQDEEIKESEIDKFEPVEITGKYMMIYHHWDGYPEGVGETLTTTYTTYEDIINLLAYGDESSINEGKVIPYSIRGGLYKKDEYTPPRFEKSIPKDLANGYWAEFVYLFRKGKWYFSPAYTNGKYRWTDLKEYLIKKKLKDTTKVKSE